MNQAAAISIPDHVRPEQVVDFDIYGHEAVEGDLHRGLKAIYDEAPDIFYTPRNGGHWVVTRLDLIPRITGDTIHFSTRVQNIPKTQDDYRLIPLNLDPPQSTPYRAILMRLFSGRTIADMEPALRVAARRLISAVASAGKCDVALVGAHFPVSVFLEILGLPAERTEEFREMVVAYFGYLEPADRIALQTRIADAIDVTIAQRRTQRHNDLISRLLDCELRGRPLTGAELQSICFTLFLGGLDTVANAISFAFHHLARDPQLQTALVKTPARSGDFVEEALRRYAIANTVRLVTRDIDIDGAALRDGDMVLCSLPAAGMDERHIADPLRFDLDRTDRQHIAFSPGSHLCIGQHLARAEIRIFVEEWLAHIPRFGLAEGFVPLFRPGTVMQLRSLAVVWDRGGGRHRCHRSYRGRLHSHGPSHDAAAESPRPSPGTRSR